MKKLMLGLGAFGIILNAAQVNVPSNSDKNVNITISQPKINNIQKSSGIIQNSPKLVRPSIIKVSGVGEGVPPEWATSPAQARALARRAAIADAYRSLAEKMFGIRLSAKDRIKDLIAQRTEVRTAVAGIIKGATIDEESWKDGLYKVVLIVNLDACRWSNYLSAPSLYKCGR